VWINFHINAAAGAGVTHLAAFGMKMSPSSDQKHGLALGVLIHF